MDRDANPSKAQPIQSIIDRALSRRAVLKGAAAGATLVIVPGALASCATADAGGDPGERLGFATVPPGDGTERDVRVPPNYEFDVVLRWGDPLFEDAPGFDVDDQTGARQARQFGFNADLVLFFPLWLGDMPALLKGFLEQVARPDFAFEYVEGGASFTKKGLKGRSARVVVTMGMPATVYRFYFRAHSVKSLERNILGFVGIAPVHETLIGMAGNMKDATALKWLGKLRDMGRDAA